MYTNYCVHTMYNIYIPGSPVINFQFSYLRAALTFVENEELALGTPFNLNIGSILCKISFLVPGFPSLQRVL